MPFLRAISILFFPCWTIAGENATTVANLGPSWSPDGSHILFYSNRSGNHDIYVMRANGDYHVRLTRDKDEEYFPKWSPDGSTIAFSAGSDERGFRIMTMAPTGFERKALTPYEHCKKPAWSPNSRSLLFTNLDGDDHEIYQIDIQNSETKPITDNNVRDVSATLSPDGSTIAIVTSQDKGFSNSTIYLMNADGSNRRRLAQNLKGCAPAWGPDSSWLVFCAQHNDQQDIYAINADGSMLERLTDSPAHDCGPAINPETGDIAFASNRTGQWEIFKMQSDGSHLVQLTRGADDRR